MINTVLEITAVAGISLLSLYLFFKDTKTFVYILLIASVLLHKELFSFYRWDLLPIRAYMLGMLAGSGIKVLQILKDKKLGESIKKFVNEPVLVILLILWLIRGASIVFSFNLTASISLYAFFTSVVVLAVVLVFHLKGNPDLAIKYLKAYIFVAFGLALFGFFQYFYHFKTGKVIGSFWVIPGNIPRVGSLFWDVNHYGSFISALLPISSVLVLLEKKWKSKILYTVISLSLLVSLVLTNSRTSIIMLGCAFASFIGLLFLRKFGSKGVVYLLLLFTLLAAPPIYEYNRKGSALRERVKQYLNYRVDSSDSHFLLIQGAFQVFEKYPILGGGYGSFFEHFSKTAAAPIYYGRDPAALTNRVPAHTIWGELVAETGILGLSVYLFLFSFILGVFSYLALKAKEKNTVLLNSAMFGVVLGWMVAGIFYSYNSEFFWIIVMLYFGYAYNTLLQEHKVSDVLYYYFKSFVPGAVVLLIGVALIFVTLGNRSLIPWDEAIYSKIAKNMVHTNQYIVQNWIPGKVWYEKPPLFMWSVATFFKLIGFNSLAAKLPSALAAVATLVIVHLFTRKHFGKTAGILAPFALITTVQYLFYARMAMTDVLCAFFITVSLLTYYNRRSTTNLNVSTFLISGIALGLAVMTKGVVGFLPLAIIGLYELYLFITKQQEFRKAVKNVGVLLVISAIIFLPWHIRMYQLFGQNFLNNYIGYHVITRATDDIENKAEPIYWYLVVMKVSMRLWFISLIPAFIFTVVNSVKNKDQTSKNKYIFLLMWSLFIFTFFSVAKSKLVWYIIPLYIPLAIINGVFISSAYNWLAKKISLFRLPLVKFISFYVFIVVILGYTFFVREMIYVSDTTGSIAQLLKLKDSSFGIEQFVYLDRVELPLAYFYTDGPFKIIDFNAQKKERIPSVGWNEKLVLITKNGRFVNTLPQYPYAANVVQTNGDYVLWYFESKQSYYENQLTLVNDQINQANYNLAKNYGVMKRAPYTFQQNYKNLLDEQARITKILEVKTDR